MKHGLPNKKMTLSYQTCLETHLGKKSALLVSLLVVVLQSIQDVRLEGVAEALPFPILFESRRKKSNDCSPKRNLR